jgi:hypothetical protein
MIGIASTNTARHVPKRQKTHASYGEDANEASTLLREESADVQSETPDRGNVAVERAEPEEKVTPAFEE